MKKLFSVVIITILIFSTVFAHEETLVGDFADGPICLNEKDYKFKDDRIEIYPKDSKYSCVVITDDYTLYVDEVKIDVNYSTRKLLKLYYNETYEIRDKAIAIGLAGAKIGLSGAKLGLTAVASLPMLIFGGADEYEARMEAAGEELEAKADALEDEADELEDQADKLEDIEDELKDRVEELDNLHWF